MLETKEQHEAQDELVYCFGCLRYRDWLEFVIPRDEYSHLMKNRTYMTWWYPHCESCREVER